MIRHVLKTGTLLLALSTGPLLLAQTVDEAVKAAMYLNGASSEEEIDEGEVERIQSVFKVQVNSPGRGARAILSEYQLATLEDYRRHHGDILSWEELALVDGFGKEAVDALKPYLSLWSESLPGAVDTSARRTHGSALVRLTEKNAGAKLKIEGNNWQVCAAARSKGWPVFAAQPDWTVHAAFGIRRWDIIIGDYNIRYGQGLSIWSGFSMTSLSTVDAFIKRHTCLTPIFSFTPSQHRGLAAEYHVGRWTVAGFGDLNRYAGLHGSYLSLKSQFGLTILPNKASLDYSLNHKGLTLTGEIASSFPTILPSFQYLFRESHPAAILATKFKIHNVKYAIQTRAIPSQFSGKKNGEYGVAAGTEWKSPKWQQLKGKEGFGSSVPKHIASLTADASLLPIPQKDPGRKQLRIYGLWQWQMTGEVAMETKITGRYRNWEPSRSDVRLDLKYASGQWLANSRMEGVYCSSPGVLAYLECGYKSSNAPFLTAYLRTTAFNTTSWSSRIYCYERDVPGSFLVPSYYGKGAVASLYGSLKLTLKHYRIKIYIRSSYTMNRDKANAVSLKCQAILEF